MYSRYHQVPVSTFQTELLPGPNLSARQLKGLGDFSDYNVTGKEHDLYPLLVSYRVAPSYSVLLNAECVQCRKFNAVVKSTSAKVVFKDIAHWSETADTDHRPDLTLYPTHPQAVAAYELTDETLSRSEAAEARKEHIARCAYAWMITAFEVKKHGAEPGFGFKPGEPLLRTTDKAVSARSQFATYAAEIMLRQHRTHVFTFYLSGWWARIFRWDRNGAIASHPIDLQTNGKQLLNLVYRLVAVNPSTQGFDITAERASEHDIERLQKYAPTNHYLKEYQDMMLSNAHEYPIFKACCLLATPVRIH